MTTNTTDQQIVLPVGTDVNDVVTHMQAAVNNGGGSGIESRLVKRYLSAADRAARNAAPNEGEFSYLMDSNTSWVYDGSAWIPLQVVAGARITNTGGPIATTSGTTELDMSRYALTVSGLRTNHYYMWRAKIVFTKSVASDTFNFKLRVNTAITGTQIQQSGFDETDGLGAGERDISFLFLGDPSYTQIFMSVQRSAGTGSLGYYGSTGGFVRSWSYIEDLGTTPQWTDAA